ncbi:hypothetical protein ES703_97140 [subsurface metagenome]
MVWIVTEMLLMRAKITRDWVARCGLRVTGCGVRVAGYALRGARCGLRGAGCGLRGARYGVRASRLGILDLKDLMIRIRGTSYGLVPNLLKSHHVCT